MNNIASATSCIYPATSSGSGRIILVGTAHVSDRSVAKVNEVIEREKPDIVAVELCEGRYQALKGEDEVKAVNIKELLGGSKFYYFLVQLLLAYACGTYRQGYPGHA